MEYNHTYSIGDTVEFGGINAIMARDIPVNSICDKYLKLANKERRRYDILQKVVNEYDKTILPEPDEIVIHLRAGNVIEHDFRSVDELLEKPCLAKASKGHRRLSSQIYIRPLKYHNLLQQAYKKKKLNKATIIIGGHMTKTFKKSLEYLDKIRLSWESNGFIVKVLNTCNADNDFVYMCRSSYFVSSGGGYSLLANKIRKLENTNKNDLIYSNFGLALTLKAYYELEQCIMKQ